MGQSRSKLELHRASLLDNLSTGALTKLLGYVNGESSLECVQSCLANNWRNRGRKNATKENLLIICTAATQGQGKTELCLQITAKSTWNGIEGIEAMVAIPVSFNQCTTFSDFDRHNTKERALVWRILHAFGNDIDLCQSYTGSLRALLDDIRRTNCPQNTSVQSVGIFLLVDEILKVKDADVEYFRGLMDFIADLQQSDLSRAIPTFVLITSLELTPVSSHIVSNSGRRLKTIPMPFFAEVDLDTAAAKLYDHILEVLSYGRNYEEMTKLKRFGNLQLLVRITVSISGRHFRTLEDAAKAVYRRLVSKSQHDLAFNDRPNSVIFSPEEDFIFKGASRVLDIFAKKGAAIDISIKEVFDCVVNLIELGSADRDMFETALLLFLQLMNDPNLMVHEDALYKLESVKILFVKFRDPSRMTYITPRISLPFLFLYPRMDLHPKLTFRCDVQPTKHQPTSNYLRSTEPRLLKYQTEMILHNMGVALSFPFSKLAQSFEEVIPLVELLTVAARNLLKLPRIEIATLVPEVLVKPWRNESLFVSGEVTTGNIIVNELIEASTPKDVAIQAVQAALKSDCKAVYLQQGATNNMQKLEHVSRLFTAGETPVLSLCSMKLREKTDPIALSKDLHRFVQVDLLNPEGNRLLCDESYYATIYCCTPKDTIDVALMPAGTVIFPYEAVSSLLYPVGLNKLLLVAEEKYRASLK